MVFPGCRQAANKDALPATGYAPALLSQPLAAELKIDTVLVRLLMNHSLLGLDKNYLMSVVLTDGKSLRQAQATISRRIVGLLGITLQYEALCHCRAPHAQNILTE